MPSPQKGENKKFEYRGKNMLSFFFILSFNKYVLSVYYLSGPPQGAESKTTLLQPGGDA